MIDDKKNKKYHVSCIILILLVAATGVLALLWSWQRALYDITVVSTQDWHPKSAPEVILYQKKHHPFPKTVKGLYLNAHSAGNPKKLDEIITLIDDTELNAVVVDIKDYSGAILYDSQVPLVRELKLARPQISNARAMIKKLHDHQIYVIARQTVFQDPILAEKKPEWALASKSGGLWRDHKGLAWVDPAKREVWDYNILIAREAMELGFDEINFDYIRFPSDGAVSNIQWSHGKKKKFEVMQEFFQLLSKELSGRRAKISADLFGFVMERTGENDLSIGQRLADTVDEFDAVSPMMYPSHYPPGHLGLSNPAEFPAVVLENGLKKGAPVFEGARARLRPWIQAFSLGATYDGDKIRAQIDTVEKYTDGGWMLWNARNVYSAAGLKAEEKV